MVEVIAVVVVWCILGFAGYKIGEVLHSPDPRVPAVIGVAFGVPGLLVYLAVKAVQHYINTKK